MKAGDALAHVTKRLGIPSCGPCAQRQKKWNAAHDRLMNALEELLGEDTVEIAGWRAFPVHVTSLESTIRGKEEWGIRVDSPEIDGLRRQQFIYPANGGVFTPLNEKPHRKVIEYFLKEAMRG